MGALKWLVGAIASLVLIAGGALFSLPYWLDMEQIKTLAISAVEKSTGRTLTINGELSVTPSLSPTISVSDVIISNPEWADNTAFTTIDQGNISLNIIPLLTGTFSINGMTLNGGTLTLESKGEQKNWEFGDKTSTPDIAAEHVDMGPEETSESSSALAVDTVTLNNIEVHYVEHIENAKHHITITSASLQDVTTDSIEAIAVTLNHMDNTINVNGQFRDDVFNGKIAAQHAQGARINADGFFNVSKQFFDLALDIEAPSVQTLGAMAGETVADKNSITLRAQAKGSKDTFSLSDLMVIHGDNAASGILDIDLSPTIPYLKADLSSDMITWSTSEKSQPPTSDTPAESDQAPSANNAAATDLSWMKQINADVSLSAGGVQIDDTSLGKTTTKASVKNGLLNVSQFNADTSQGSLSGNATLDANTSPANLSSTLYANDVVVEKLMETLGQKAPVSGGNLKGMIALAGPFNNADTFLNTSDGAIKLFLDQLTYQDAGLDKAASFMSVLQGKDDKDNASIGVECLIADFDVKQGTATSNSLAMKTDGAIVKGDGTIRLSDLDSNLTLKARSHFVGLADVAPALKLSGPLSDPNVTLDAGNTVLGIGKLVIGATSGIGLAAVLGEQVTNKLGITEDSNPCLKSIAEFEQKMNEAPKPTAKETYKAAEDKVRAVRDNVKKDFKSGKTSVKKLKDDLKDLKSGLKNFLP